MFLGFFILKFLKSKTLLVLLAEAKLIILSATLSLKLHNQFGLRTCENFFTNRAVPLSFKYNLLLLRHEPSILLLLMKLVPLPLLCYHTCLSKNLANHSECQGNNYYFVKMAYKY